MYRAQRSAPGFALSLVLVAAALSAQDIRLGSIDAARFGTDYTLNGANLERARVKLLHEGNFSDPDGVVPHAVVITDTAAPITEELLAAFDVFYIGYLSDNHANAFTEAELDAFFAWVQGGGAMLVTCDNQNHDAVCQRFGLPLAGDDGDDIIDASGPGFGHPALVGPFGPVRQVTALYDIGTFEDPSAGEVVLRSSAGREAFGVVGTLGAGRVMVLGDVDMFSDFALTDDDDIYGPNDSLLGNAVTWLAGLSDSGLCTPSETRLCLDGAIPGDGRFAVTLSFLTVQGGGLSGDALATPLQGVGARQGGLFTFFDPANPEMVVKILDGCLINNHFWVFASAGTNVGFTMVIDDLTVGGPPKLYSNADLTVAAPIQDVNALLCAP